MATRLSFATFWNGSSVAAFEASCLMSYVRHGHEMTVYSYGRIDNLPKEIKLQPATDIVEEYYVDKFLIRGAPSLSHFSDLFRYNLFARTDQIWVDSDMFLIRDLDLPVGGTLLAREDDDVICGAIMKLDRNNPALQQLVERTKGLAGRDIQWGETGPRLLTSVFGSDVVANAWGADKFYPVHYDEFWKVFLPEYRQECEKLCERANTLHLWNNIVTKMGFWKNLLPPEDSFLNHVLSSNDMTGLFLGTLPAEVMRNVIDNYRMRMSGSFSDVQKLARLAIPGLQRRALRKLRALSRSS